MVRGRMIPAVPAIVYLVVLVGCTGASEQQGETRVGTFEVEFQDVQIPEVLNREGTAIAAEGVSAAGLWGVVPGLNRPERAIVRNLASGKSVTVALYRSDSRLDGHLIELSSEASAEIGITDKPGRVVVTAVRSEPVILSR